MAHKKEIKDSAKQLYLIEGKKPDEIGEILSISARTIMRWKDKENWDASLRTGNIELSLSVEHELINTIKNAIKAGNLADPKVADACSKLQKIMQALRPKRQILGNLMLFCEALADYSVNCKDEDFLTAIQKHLPYIKDFIKVKYNKGS